MKDTKLIYKLNKEWRSGKARIKRISGHTTNKNWIVECQKKKKFFVRLPWERTDIVDRETEGKEFLAISQNKKLIGAIPKFLLYIFKKRDILNPKEEMDFPDGTMIMEYIEGKDINGKDLESPKIQKALVKALHAFHASGVRFVNVYDVFQDEAARYRKKARKHPVSKLIQEERIKKIEEIEKKTKKEFPLGGKLSTHNDLIFTNLRLGKDGKVYILDFEYAGLNVRSGLYYDLGIILGGNLFYEKPINMKVFREILKKAKKIYRKDLDDYKIYCGALTNILVMFWWGVIKYFDSETKEEKRYFKDYVLKRAKGIEELFVFLNREGVKLP